jgi:hypothetical protein
MEEAMTGRLWTEKEVDVLRQHYPTTRAKDLLPLLPGRTVAQICDKANSSGIKKTPETIAETSRRAMENPNHGGRKCLFHSEQTPWNKGVPYVAGGRSAETRFKPGQKPRMWHPIGHERVTYEGYLQRKMADTGVTRRDYVNVHHLIWREAGNDIPPGHILIFRDGNKANFALENLELITRKENMRRNSVHNLPKELAELCQLKGALQRKINAKQKGKTT